MQELAYGTLRYWGRLAALTDALATKPLSDPLLAALVAVALYQLDHTDAPAFAVVDRAVDAAALLVRPQAKALVNAMLRRYLRERDALNAKVAAAQPGGALVVPALVDRARARPTTPRTGKQSSRPGTSVRRSPCASIVESPTRDTLAARFASEGIAADAVGASGLIVREPRPVTELPGYADGAFSVQDAGAQLAAPLLDVHDGMRVLDACAAPGGKTTHIAELADVDVTALDSDPARLLRVTENVARLGLAGVRVQAGDAGEPGAWWDGRPFDRILADVPCTASGIVRRHPDGKWLRRKSDLGSFAVAAAAARPRAVAAARARRAPAVCDLLGVRRGE